MTSRSPSADENRPRGKIAAARPPVRWNWRSLVTWVWLASPQRPEGGSSVPREAVGSHPQPCEPAVTVALKTTAYSRQTVVGEQEDFLRRRSRGREAEVGDGREEWGSGQGSAGGAVLSPVPMVFPQGPETPDLRLLAPSQRHSWDTSGETQRARGSVPAPGLGVDGSLLPPCRLLKYREFRRHWEPWPGWELSLSWECAAGGGWECAAGGRGGEGRPQC